MKTPQYHAVQRATRERIMANQYRQVGKLGVILSGAPGQGKTTTLMQIGKEHELRRRNTGHPAAAKGNLPVVYVAVPAQCSAKALMCEFARFLGLPALERRTYGVLLDMVANALRRCSTELILVDDIHHLDLRYRQNIEASDMLKQLSERCGGTFVYAGIDVEETGLLSGTREGQIRKRFEVHTAEPYRISDEDGRADWGRPSARDRRLAVPPQPDQGRHPGGSVGPASPQQRRDRDAQRHAPDRGKSRYRGGRRGP
ncbi:MAG TPA: ATP-binding protein [Candidatus Microbacterium pullistercoris]|nr:ATP-binding protein [Candidatus Microbacterium pullistercoris]